MHGTPINPFCRIALESLMLTRIAVFLAFIRLAFRGYVAWWKFHNFLQPGDSYRATMILDVNYLKGASEERQPTIERKPTSAFQ